MKTMIVLTLWADTGKDQGLGNSGSTVGYRPHFIIMEMRMDWDYSDMEYNDEKKCWKRRIGKQCDENITEVN